MFTGIGKACRIGTRTVEAHQRRSKRPRSMGSGQQGPQDCAPCCSRRLRRRVAKTHRGLRMEHSSVHQLSYSWRTLAAMPAVGTARPASGAVLQGKRARQSWQHDPGSTGLFLFFFGTATGDQMRCYSERCASRMLALGNIPCLVRDVKVADQPNRRRDHDCNVMSA